MECFNDLKNSIGDLLTNSQKSCCESNQLTCERSNLSGGTIAGIVIGSIVGALLIIGLIIFIIKKNKSNQNRHKELSIDSFQMNET